MKYLLRILLLAAAAPALSGCVPMMAASAAGMAAEAAQGHPATNEVLQPQAREACSAEAAKYGDVHVIDVEQHSASRIIVWGTVEGALDRRTQKRSFECDFGTRITGFTLRPIAPR